MKLHEIATKPPMDVGIWFGRYSRVQGLDFKVQTDGLVNVYGDVELESEVSEFPFPFGLVTGTFDCANTNITSLRNAPRVVGGMFSCANTRITSLEGIPRRISNDCYCYGLQKVLSLSGINKLVSSIDRGFYGARHQTHLLGLLLINGITKISIDRNGPIDIILNRYLGTEDVLSAQDELLDAGFKEQARF